jgi:hypothetical protein
MYSNRFISTVRKIMTMYFDRWIYLSDCHYIQMRAELEFKLKSSKRDKRESIYKSTIR